MILIVTKYFPPQQTVGVTRVASFARYLCEMGWHAHALKAPESDELPVDIGACESLRGAVQCTVAKPTPWRLVRSNAHWLMLVCWYACVWKDRFDVVLATGGPFANFIGAAFFSLLHRKPLVLDYRDPWTCPSRSSRTPGHQNWKGRLAERFCRRMEMWCLRRATAVIVTTEAHAGALKSWFPAVANQLHVICNGHPYLNRPAPMQPMGSEDGHVDFLYSGRVGSHTPVDCLMTAIEEVRKHRPDVYERLHFHFVGEVDSTQSAWFHRSEKVLHRDRLRFEETLALQRRSHALLSLDSHNAVIPTKLFEYVAASRPVLNVTPAGGAAFEMFRNVRGVHCVDHRDAVGLARVIIEIVEGLSRGDLEFPDDEVFQRFSRRNAALQLDRVLRKILSESVAP